MSRIDLPNWTHKSGYRLNADGKSIKYTHDGRPLEAYVESCLNENEGEMEYRPCILNTETGEFVVYPEMLYDSDDALDRLEMHMEYYS